MVPKLFTNGGSPGGKAPDDGREGGLPPLTWPLGHPNELTPDVRSRDGGKCTSRGVSPTESRLTACFAVGECIQRGRFIEKYNKPHPDTRYTLTLGVHT